MTNRKFVELYRGRLVRFIDTDKPAYFRWANWIGRVAEYKESLVRVETVSGGSGTGYDFVNASSYWNSMSLKLIPEEPEIKDLPITPITKCPKCQSKSCIGLTRIECLSK